MMSATDIHSVHMWQKQAKKAGRKSDAEWLYCNDYICGRGGALFIGIHKRREDSSVNLLFQQLEIVRNEAVVGGTAPAESEIYKSSFAFLGGIYIENDLRDNIREADIGCPTNQPILEPCLYLAFKSVNVEHNIAMISGGGVFITSS